MYIRRLSRRALPIVALLPLLTLLSSVPAHAAPLFGDGFESGDLSAWTASASFQAQQQFVFTGSWAGRATSTGADGYAYETLATAQSDIFFDARFDLLSATGSTTILRLRTSAGKPLVSLNVTKGGKLARKNHVTGVTRASATAVSKNAWHEAQLHALVNGTSSLIEVWFDGTRVTDISGADSLGTTAVGRVQLGLNGSNNGFDVAFDDATADTAFIGSTDTEKPSQPQNLHATSIASNEVDLAWDASTDDFGVAGYTIYRGVSAIATVGGATLAYADLGVSPNSHYTYTVDAFDAAANHSDPSTPLDVDTPASTGDPVIVAAGDIACDTSDVDYNGGNGTATSCRQKSTANLLGGADAVLTLGDEQYECGGLSVFNQVYDSTWGQKKSITYPVPGNHEYDTSGGTDCGTNAAGYFSYFGTAAHPSSDGYYSFNLGSWHVVALNGECSNVPGGCGAGSPEETWLASDLAASGSQCTLAFWHRPRFASNTSGGYDKVGRFWQDLYDAGADIVLNGHQHFYERFRAQDPSGSADPNGIVEFIVGTGGKSRGGLVSPRLANSVVADAKTFGVLKLTLHASGYDWTFVGEPGSTFTDSGSATCS